MDHLKHHSLFGLGLPGNDIFIGVFKKKHHQLDIKAKPPSFSNWTFHENSSMESKWLQTAWLSECHGFENRGWGEWTSGFPIASIGGIFTYHVYHKNV